MTTKQELLDKIEELKAKVKEIDKPKPTGVIYDEPDEGDNILVLGQEEDVSHSGYSAIWKPEFTQGHLFYDEASAIHTGKVRAIRHRLAGVCAKAWRDAGKVVDWSDKRQHKHNLCWRFDSESIGFDYWVTTKAGDFHLPTYDLTELKKQFTSAELKLAITG